MLTLSRISRHIDNEISSFDSIMIVSIHFLMLGLINRVNSVVPFPRTALRLWSQRTKLDEDDTTKE